MEEFKRICGKCGRIVYHKSQKSLERMIRKKALCRSCGCNKPERLAVQAKINLGKNNPFFGKKHTDETKKRMVENKDYSWMQSSEYRDKVSKQCTGFGNPMNGKTYYSTWVKKYGKEEADRRQAEKNKKTSVQCKGSGNPMFGKPAPVGSGCGWSGWYKGWYFRSLKELSYMVNVIERNNYKWRTGETKDLEIPYVDEKGSVRTYRVDFLLQDKVMIEIKPDKLMSSKVNEIKRKAAIEFCDKKQYLYIMLDIDILSKNKIIELYNDKKIKFIDKYETKMKEMLKCK